MENVEIKAVDTPAKKKINKHQIITWIIYFVVIIAALIIGYGTNEIKHKLADAKPIKVEQVKKVNEPITLESVSVAISERNELIMINRQTGDYQIYNSDVSDALFATFGKNAMNKK